MSEPSGIVTLVFSDIEGSTKLLEALGTSAYRQALAEHRQIVREAFARYRGYEVDYEGDAFFYAFDSAQQAVSAVSEAMQGLEAGPISIRVGIHTGEPELDPPKYVGMDVHTAARIMSSGHGGQVVVSKTTAALVDTPLQELGEHRLKDIQEAVPLYQLGEGSFPPLKTISNTNLPTAGELLRGQGRRAARGALAVRGQARAWSRSPGPAAPARHGSPSRLPPTLVPEFKAGVFWVGLATLRDPALVTETIAQTLGAKDGLADHIGEREMLLAARQPRAGDRLRAGTLRARSQSVPTLRCSLPAVSCSVSRERWSTRCRRFARVRRSISSAPVRSSNPTKRSQSSAGAWTTCR